MGLSAPGSDVKEKLSVSQLAEDIIEVEKEIGLQLTIREERKSDLEAATQAFNEQDRKVENLCRRRNALIKEISTYQVVEYEGDDK